MLVLVIGWDALDGVKLVSHLFGLVELIAIIILTISNRLSLAHQLFHIQALVFLKHLGVVLF